MLNEMMYKKIINSDILDYIRNSQRKFYKELDELEQEANKLNMPIIPHETAVFIDFLLSIFKPKKILEIGTAIGYSSILMSASLQKNGKIYTIERNPKMYNQAIENIKKFNLEDRIQVVFGDAKNILPSLENTFDFIFMDSAKSKYVDFLPICINLLNDNGFIIIDDIFQGGSIFDDEINIPRRNRSIHKKLNELLDFVKNTESIKYSLVPLGDGILMIKKSNAK